MGAKITRREALKKICKTTGGLWGANSFIMALVTSPILSISELSTARAEKAREIGNISRKSPVDEKTMLNRSTPNRTEKAGDLGSILQKSPESEKIMINGSGSSLNFRISGPANRYCAVVFRPSGSMEKFKIFPKTKSMLNSKGYAGLLADIKGLSDGTYEFVVVTASSSNFNSALKGTEDFQIKIKAGQIVGLLGPRQRETSTVSAVGMVGGPEN